MVHDIRRVDRVVNAVRPDRPALHEREEDPDIRVGDVEVRDTHVPAPCDDDLTGVQAVHDEILASLVEPDRLTVHQIVGADRVGREFREHGTREGHAVRDETIVGERHVQGSV